MNINTPSITPEYDLDSELEKLYGSITSRSFSYNPSADPLYRSYADSYARRGRMAMRDTMGQAAALTGGYGSSYAQRVGQQQYNEYLSSLSDVLPELYDMAYTRYQSETDSLQSAYDMNWQRREDEYKRGRDANADAIAAEERDYKRKRQAYEDLVALIGSTGYEPTDDDLESSGLSREQAEAIRQTYLRENGLLPAASGGGWDYGYGTEDYGEDRRRRTNSSKAVSASGKSSKALL